MSVEIDYVMITALRADYKKQKIVITVECALGKDVMSQMPEISRWAAYDQPVSLSLSKIQEEMPWVPSGGGGSLDVKSSLDGGGS